jgi:hypothetical protein
MGILIIFLNFIYQLKVKVKRIKMALTLDGRVEIVLIRVRQGWSMLLKSEIFVTFGRELQTEQNPHKHGKKNSVALVR